MMAEKRRLNWKPFALVGALVALMVLAKVLDLGERLVLVRDWIGSLGAFGPVAFCALYIVAAVAMVPGIALTVGAGALFRSVWGSIYVSIGSTRGSAASFLVARYVARDSVLGWLSENPGFRRLDEMTERHGAMIVAITRLVPIFPYNLLNYGYGLTKVPFATYVLWSWLCMIPATVLYVVGADALFTGVRDGEIPWPLLGALAVIVVLTFFIVRIARRRLKEVEA